MIGFLMIENEFAEAIILILFCHYFLNIYRVFYQPDYDFLNIKKLEWSCLLSFHQLFDRR